MSDSDPGPPCLTSSSSSQGVPSGRCSRSVSADSASSVVGPAGAWAEAPFSPEGLLGSRPLGGVQLPGEASRLVTPNSRSDEGLDWLSQVRPAAILAGLAIPALARDRPRSHGNRGRVGSAARWERQIAVALAACGGEGRAAGEQCLDSVRPPPPAQSVRADASQSTGAPPPTDKIPRGRKQAQRPQRSRRHRDKR